MRWCPGKSTRRCAAAATRAVAPTAAQAHVKWFAPYDITAAPLAPSELVQSPHFWMGLGLITFFFLAASVIKRTALGTAITRVLDSLSEPLAHRMGGFVRVITGAFLSGCLRVAAPT